MIRVNSFVNTGFEAGIKLSKEKLEFLKKQGGKALRSSLEEGARIIYEMALYYCPIETGLLRSYSLIELPEGDEERFVIRIVFYAPYALYVHERVELNHAAPTQAKFLERAVRDTYTDVTWAIGTSFKITGEPTGHPGEARMSRQSGAVLQPSLTVPLGPGQRRKIKHRLGQFGVNFQRSMRD